MRLHPAPDARMPLRDHPSTLLYQQMARAQATGLGALPAQIHHENYGAMLDVVAEWLHQQGHSYAALDIQVAAREATAGR